MENLQRILAEHPFFEGMDAAHIALLVGCASNVAFKADEYIFREGGPADTFYIVRHGRVMLETFAPQKGPVMIQTLKEDDILGWSWLIPPYRWHFDARADGQVRAIALDGKCLREKCETDHDLGYELMKRFTVVISQRLDATRLQLLDIYGNGGKS